MKTYKGYNVLWQAGDFRLLQSKHQHDRIHLNDERSGSEYSSMAMGVSWKDGSDPTVWLRKKIKTRQMGIAQHIDKLRDQIEDLREENVRWNELSKKLDT